MSKIIKIVVEMATIFSELSDHPSYFPSTLMISISVYFGDSLLFVNISVYFDDFDLFVYLSVYFDDIHFFTGPHSAVGNASGNRCESNCRSSRLRAKKGPAPPLGNFADISYLEENFKPHLLRDVCTLCSGALVSDSLLHMLL